METDPSAPRRARRPSQRGLGIALIGLGSGLGLNALLGPLAADVIRYRFSETLVLQGIGLDLISLALVAPLCMVLGGALLRGRRRAALPALAVSSYGAYMSIQYVIGPEYLELAGNNERFFAFHLSLFVLSLLTAVRSWTVARGVAVDSGERTDRRWGALLLGLSALLVLRYLPAILDLAAGTPAVAEYRENPTSFFLIAFMDLGIVAPAAAAAGLGLRRGRDWARTALFGIVGWFGLVGPAVASMAVTMWRAGDPAGSVGAAAAFTAGGAVLLALALRLHGGLIAPEG